MRVCADAQRGATTHQATLTPCSTAKLQLCQVRESGDGMSLPAAVSGGGRKDEEKYERRMDNSFFPVERKVPFTCKK